MRGRGSTVCGGREPTVDGEQVRGSPRWPPKPGEERIPGRAWDAEADTLGRTRCGAPHASRQGWI
ncbi:hypothetical protein WBG99_07590 [Streptomyces sp. TG1A-60]|uniref:hypothetical protein n=1 Tax=Streptomyces sp. TG1A-60 TaxID=3129111 RepID=UPI0030CB982A